MNAKSVARWDGAAWQPIGTGISGNVNALEVFRGALIAGGEFTGNNIARWDGSLWQQLGGGLGGGIVYALTEWNAGASNQLVAGGFFVTAGGNISVNFARWGPLCPGDLDQDGAVGAIDLQALLDAWGACPQPCPPSCIADLDADCDVDVVDLLTLLDNWG